jgi:uracil phosphoribosyltransferase
MLHNISKENSIAHQFMNELREENIQKDAMRFRKNLFRLGQILAYEISKELSYKNNVVTTPLGEAEALQMSDKIVLGTILRAGIPLHQGMLDFFDNAENAFVAAYRLHHKDGTFEINEEYITCPNLDGKILILADPMLATGASFDTALTSLKEYGTPKKIHIVSAIASVPGVNHISRLYPNADIWIAALDEELTAKSYIVPGLGDAGDLAFGSKMQE